MTYLISIFKLFVVIVFVVCMYYFQGLISFFLNVYLRERACMKVGEGQRESFTLSMEPEAGLGLMTVRSQPELT